MNYGFTQQWTLIGRAKAGRDAYNDDTFTETRHTVDVVFDPGGSLEVLNGGDTVTTQPTLYGLPTDLPVTAVDAAEAPDGTRYEVDGAPVFYPPNPFTGTQVGGVLKLKRVTG